MVVIVCLDDDGGMMYHHRRQSRDRAVTERLQQLCMGKKLWMHPYSYKLYGELKDVGTIADEAFLAKAGSGEFCLAETEKLAPVEEKIEGLYVFWWNRKYPSDFCLDLNLADWEKVNQQKFSGVSHEMITEEFYKRNGACV